MDKKQTEIKKDTPKLPNNTAKLREAIVLSEILGKPRALKKKIR